MSKSQKNVNKIIQINYSDEADAKQLTTKN